MAVDEDDGTVVVTVTEARPEFQYGSDVGLRGELIPGLGSIASWNRNSSLSWSSKALNTSGVG